MTKKLLISFWLLLGLISFLTSQALAAAPTESTAKPVPIEVFERLECSHCQAEKAFFAGLTQRRSDFTVRFHDIAQTEHYQHWQQITNLENLAQVTPLTLIGTTIIEGFDSAQTTGAQIETLITQRQGQKNYTFEEFIVAGGSAKLGSEKVAGGATCADGSGCPTRLAEPWLITLPLIGPVNIKLFSLPILSIVLGFVDGFNPCAMWVLVTFLIVLAQVGSRHKMWQVAGLFILAEAIMYYLILNVWFTAWDFVGLDNLVTPLIGLVAIGGGLFFLYEWRTNHGTCTIISGKKREKTARRISEFVKKPLTLITALGIMALAFSVNVIEFACSIGIPQAFTKIIELNQPGFWLTQWYLALYILFYMIDDLIVFGIALYSFEKIGLTSKYSRWSNLIGGILMLILGLLLIFQRQWLIFG